MSLMHLYTGGWPINIIVISETYNNSMSWYIYIPFFMCTCTYSYFNVNMQIVHVENYISGYEMLLVIGISVTIPV